MKKLSLKKIFTKLMFILIFIYVVMTLISQQKKINFYETNIVFLSEEIENEKEYKKELMATKENINSEEYIEQVAREKLNMYLPNEKVYVDIGN